MALPFADCSVRAGFPSPAVMLASAAGAFISGQNLVVDGGTLVSDGG